MSAPRERIIGLIDEKPLLVYPSAAKYLGISKAIIIQQLHFWITIAEQQADPKHFIDGEWWVYNSYADWQKHHFPWLSKGTLKRLFAELEADGLIKSRVIPGRGKKNWYTINVTNWNQFVLSMDKKVPEKPSKGIKMIPSGYQNDTDPRTPENTTESKEKENIVSASETALPSVSDEKPVVSKKPRKPDEMFEAIATVWKTRAGGFVGQMKAMFLGRARASTEWGACNFEPSATPEEILTFGKYAEKRRIRENCSFPKTPETIQRWFYDMREAMKPRTALPVTPYTFTLDPEVNAARLRESVSQ